MRGLDWNDPLRIRTVEEMINYIHQVGFLPLFANELPGFSGFKGLPVFGLPYLQGRGASGRGED